MERIRAGFCEIPNPMFPNKRYTISLRREDVDCFVFWTRYPRQLFPYLKELDYLGYPYYFLYTLVDYPSDFEPGIEALSKRVEMFRRLSDHIGPGRTVWRYDPILLSDRTGYSYHLNTFSALAESLSDYTDTVITSFYDPYKKAENRLRSAGITAADPRSQSNIDETMKLLRKMRDLGERKNLRIQTCAESLETETISIPRGSCIDKERIHREFGISLRGGKDKGQRKLCGCHESRDVGTYGTCRRGCLYCYAK